MSEQNIDQNYRCRKRWKKVIEYLRTRYLRNISRIPIAQKAHRLLLLNEATEEALTYHTKSVNEWGTIMEKRVGIIPALIAEARKEVEGDRGTLAPEQGKSQTPIIVQIRNVLNGNSTTTTIARGIAGDLRAISQRS